MVYGWGLQGTVIGVTCVSRRVSYSRWAGKNESIKLDVYDRARINLWQRAGCHHAKLGRAFLSMMESFSLKSTYIFLLASEVNNEGMRVKSTIRLWGVVFLRCPQVLYGGLLTKGFGKGKRKYKMFTFCNNLTNMSGLKIIMLFTITKMQICIKIIINVPHFTFSYLK